MIYDQQDDTLKLIRGLVTGEVVEVELSGTASRQMERCDLNLADVLYVMRHITSLRRHGQWYGCYVVEGADVDGAHVAVVIEPPSHKNTRLRLLNIGRLEVTRHV